MVQVLLSTYNGEKYLRTQIDSILKQKGVEIKLLIRDDCSTDTTTIILEEYSNKYKNVNYYVGKNNIGAPLSFIELLGKVNNIVDYVAFADQDDIWHENKICSAIEKLENYSECPALYYCEVNVVDTSRNPIISNFNKRYPLTLSTVIMSESPPGCSMVINRILIDLIKMYTPKRLRMHDFWSLLVCIANNGMVIHDKRKFIDYRQHSHNVIGGRYNFIKRYKRLIHSFFYGNNERSAQARELYEAYERYMLPENKQILLEVVNYKDNKFRLMRDKRFRLDFSRNLMFYFSVLTGRF